MNVTNITNTTTEAGAPVPNAFLQTTFVFGIMVFITSLLAIVILYRCKKIVEQIRLTSIHLCVANCGYGLTMISNSAYFLINRTPCGSIFKLIPYFCLLYFMFLTFTGIDRLLSLKFSMKYKFWSRNRNMYIVTASLYFISIFLGIIPNISSNGLFQCASNEFFTYSGLVTFVTTMFLLNITHLFCFICIGYLVMKKTLPGPFEKDTIYTKYWTITEKMLKLVASSILFLTPYLISRWNDIVNFQENGKYVNVSVFSYISVSLLHIHQIFSPIFILCTYHECRFIALKSVLCCRPNLKQKLEERYKEHYSTYKISSQ